MQLRIPKTETVEQLIDKAAIRELIEFERYCRDNAQWEEMHTCFAEQSTVTVSWYQGDGHGFVDASSKMKTKAPHKINNTLVWLNGSRAVAVTMASIQTRSIIGGKEYDLTSYVRLLYTAQKEPEGWKLVSMDCIYEKDSLVPAAPAEYPANSGFRPSYGNLAAVLAAEGHAINSELPGDDRPEQVTQIMKKAATWINER